MRMDIEILPLLIVVWIVKVCCREVLMFVESRESRESDVDFGNCDLVNLSAFSGGEGHVMAPFLNVRP